MGKWRVFFAIVIDQVLKFGIEVLFKNAGRPDEFLEELNLQGKIEQVVLEAKIAEEVDALLDIGIDI